MAVIFIIDDEESIRFSLRHFLQAEGHTVGAAASFEESLKLLEETTPDLIFADILLEDRSGLDLLRHVKDHGLSCPVIMITGKPKLHSATEALRNGAYEYLVKPVTREQVLQLARTALGHKRLSDERQKLLAEKDSLHRYLEAVFQSASDAIITVDKDLTIVKANDSCRAVLGIHPGELIRSHIQALGPYREILEEVLTATLKSQAPIREYRVEHPRAGDEKQVLSLSCSPLHEENGLIGAVLILRDITRQATLESHFSTRRRFRNIVGQSKAMQQIYRLLESLAETDTTVLISGPSGTGKELVADALHYSGHRAEKPLVKVNCSALSEYLLESELFGHVRGAFTGAVKDKEGRFAKADGGTIFLDEIGDISPHIQLKLLRVLQEKEFERVGDNRTIKVDVRVLAATNQNLRELVRRGRFREDLFYRLKVVEMNLPPLHERPDDIQPLADHFIGEFNRQFRRNVSGLSQRAQALLQSYPWPGNIRELKHAIEHSFILSQDSLIDVGHLPQEIRDYRPSRSAQALDKALGPEALAEAFTIAPANTAQAARNLHNSRQTLYRKMREFDLPSN